MRLIHYSYEPLPQSVKNDYKRRGCFKPPGLWVSVEGEYDWPWWCLAEDYQITNLWYATEIILTKDANILHLRTPEDLDKFSEQYAYDNFRITGYYQNHSVHWDKLQEKYQGIIISPYIWERRLTNNTFWYYGWDCASGCIWDTACINGGRALWNLRVRAEVAWRIIQRSWHK